MSFRCRNATALQILFRFVPEGPWNIGTLNQINQDFRDTIFYICTMTVFDSWNKYHVKSQQWRRSVASSINPGQEQFTSEFFLRFIYKLRGSNKLQTKVAIKFIKIFFQIF